MKFIQCKDDAAKLQAIRNLCDYEIGLCNYRIKSLESEKCNPLDYCEEINEQEIKKRQLETIVRIIDESPVESIMVY